jgi:exonuclease VII large subunit
MLSTSSEARIAELEEELRNLKANSAIAQPQIEVDHLSKKLEGKEKITLDHRNSSLKDKTSLVSCSLSNEGNSLGGSFNIIESEPYPFSFDGNSSQASTNFISEAFESFGKWSQHREGRRQTRIEQELMRQLEFLYEDKVRCVRELELKLSQREAAIATLETALQHMESTIKVLRDEIEMFKSPSYLLKNNMCANSSPSKSNERNVPSFSKGKTPRQDDELRSSMVVLIPKFISDSENNELNLFASSGKKSKEKGTQRHRSLSPKAVCRQRGVTPTRTRQREKNSKLKK